MGPNSEKPIAFSESNSLARAWFAGNSLNGEVPAAPWSLVTGLEVEGYRQAAPIDIAPIVADPAASAYQRVLAETGASVARDAVDARVVAGVRDRTGRIINNEQDVGGWPELAAGEATVDTDGDGMPDAWEAAHGLNPNKPDGAAPARDGSGWTNLELYLADAAKVRG
ncbi:thrombospondin type 3 repeat-containing protein [Caulobacter sp. B11]|uniref:thrombospondin type 3 repeat-containing protein n=1 Tax=Caulobacter sp. B11 TaxID=2048899 RepID=UPI001F220AE8|nr:thrombospondin type 3 repeat-containing protein [Caulobacter sp. B11]